MKRLTAILCLTIAVLLGSARAVLRYLRVLQTRTDIMITTLAPIPMPTVVALGVDPVHFGVITVFNRLIGLVTPPYGLTMYLLCEIAEISLHQFWRHMWPIFLTMLIFLFVVTYVPIFTTWLPNLVMPIN